MRTLALLLPAIGVASAADSRFVRVQGKDLVVRDGKKILLRGINPGNWLVPEGYMFHFDNGPSSAREFETLFSFATRGSTPAAFRSTGS